MKIHRIAARLLRPRSPRQPLPKAKATDPLWIRVWARLAGAGVEDEPDTSRRH